VEAVEVSTSKARRLAKLRELTETRNQARDAFRAAGDEARPIVRQLLREGVAPADLIGLPYSRPEVYSIRRGLQDAGELPAD
jgi:hypothetical protein